MHRRVELLAPAGSYADAEAYLRSGADAVVVGHERYALRLPGSMEADEIAETVRMAKALNKRVYVAITALIHEFVVSELEGYIGRLGQCGVDAVVYGDPAVFMAARRAWPAMALHWNTETTSTNFRTVNFWAKRGVGRALLARELSMEEVLDVKRNTKAEVEVQVHGMTCIFHSKRELVKSYMDHRGMGQADGKTYLREEKRGEDHQYPIFEDAQGTHVMSDEDICMIEHLPSFLEAGIDSLKIETLLKSREANVRTISIYNDAIDTLISNPLAVMDPGWKAELMSLQPANRPLGTGFYFKEQIY